MSLANLDQKERDVVRECLTATIDGLISVPPWDLAVIFDKERPRSANVVQSPGLF
jgi:hypothetical protein